MQHDKHAKGFKDVLGVRGTGNVVGGEAGRVEPVERGSVERVEKMPRSMSFATILRARARVLTGINSSPQRALVGWRHPYKATTRTTATAATTVPSDQLGFVPDKHPTPDLPIASADGPQNRHSVDSPELVAIRLVNTFEIPPNIKPHHVQASAEGLEVVWPASGAEYHSSFYPWPWLKAHTYDPRPKSPPTFSERVLWGAKIAKSPPTVSYEDAMDEGDQGLYKWLSNIDRFGFCLVSGVPATPEATEKLSKRIGFIRETQYGKFWEFTADLSKGDTAYTTMALGAHTDNTYFTDPCGLQLFHLLSHTEGSGGATLLVDGFYVASLLKELHPDAYELLSRIPIPAHAAGEATALYRPSPPSGYPPLRHDELSGELVQVRWNNDDRSVMDQLDAGLVESWYDAIRAWHGLLTSADSEYWVQLMPGTVLCVDNHRVLHGRSAFNGKRRLLSVQHTTTMGPSYGIVPPDIRPLKHAGAFPLLPTTTFARMHLDHITAHPPDSVLFPFLHGLDGDNDAQCMFFASSSASPDKPIHPAAMVRDSSGRVVRPPRYRGLVWVLCDDDLDAPSSPISEDTEYDTDSDDFSDPDVEMASLEQDPPTDIEPTPSFMHPTTLRISTAASNTDTNTSVPVPSAPLNIIYTDSRPLHDRRHSSTSDSDSSTDASSSSSNSHSRSTSATSLPSPTSLPCPGLLDASAFETAPPLQSVPATVVSSQKTLKKNPTLTCTFLPSQLIQPCPPPRAHDFHGWARGDTAAFEIDWEFKPAKVPDGISLRNFGIQVPLYTSISDIVVYSPKGPTPATLRVAARFKKAVEKKRRERLERTKTPTSTPEGFLKYGVYILDANAEQIERDLPWLVVKKDSECAGYCEHPPPTRTENRRLVGESEIEARRLSPFVQPNADCVASLDRTPMNVNTRIHRCKRANTIDFARREKDEMRELTCASEILTVWASDDKDMQADEAPGSTTATYWNPNAGQVFLGNSNDVPLWKPPLRRRGHIPPPESDAAAHPTTSPYMDPFADPLYLP
ncbi:hypothetical protein J3R82DRAFT_11841 [Butyriboletus roseoflavus]|nr:hypothetical protein J3R82DRAFT_11841 [Butyriboletus roseoflavus]